MSFNGPMSDISDNSHGLLEPPSPAYSNVTVRRAFVVWMYCGQRNKFKDVCNYFHYLEALEDQLPPERRAASRDHEFNLFTNQPPTSTFLIAHFPRLYKETYVERHNISKVEETQNEKCVFKLEGFNEIAPKYGTTAQEIVEASRMIRKYCKIQMVSLKKFLEEFKQHARKCDLKFTVNNVAFYIKRKLVQAEIELEANYPKTLGFLNSASIENLFNNIQDTTIKEHNTLKDYVVKDCETVSSYKNAYEDNNFKPFKILRKGAGDLIEITKNDCSNSFGNDSNYINIDIDKKTINNSPIFDKTDFLIAATTKSVSIDDLTDENLPLKKERRFSGSRFMKIELDKFRKI